MKKIMSLCLSLVLILSMAGAVAAAERPISLWYGEQQVELGAAQPVLQDGVTLVPVKPLFAQMSLELAYDTSTRIITGQNDDLSISVQVGAKEATVNGNIVTLPAAVTSLKDVTYVPVRALGEAAGYRVVWDAQQRAIQLVGAAGEESQAGQEGQAGEEATGEGSKGFLWKAEGEGSDVYLLGSIHVADSDMYPLRAEIEEAFAASDYLGVELDISDVSQDMEALTAELGMYQDGTTLKDHIPAETYAALGELLKGLGLPEDSFDAFKPWMVSTTIDYLQIGDAGYEGDLGIDMYFLQEAKKRKLPILELESAELQLKMFNSFSDELQLQMLEGSIAAYNAGPDENAQFTIDHMIQMWIDGDHELLGELTEQFGPSGEYMDAMLTNRNKGMVDKVKGYLDDKEGKTYFVVVGAAHMVGPSGIVTKLREQGYTVTEL